MCEHVPVAALKGLTRVKTDMLVQRLRTVTADCSQSWPTKIKESKRRALTHHNEVGRPDSRQAVGNNDAGALLVAHQLIESLLDHPLGLRIQRARGLVQQKDVGLPHNGPRNGNALLLPAGKL